LIDINAELEKREIEQLPTTTLTKYSQKYKVEQKRRLLSSIESEAIEEEKEAKKAKQIVDDINRLKREELQNKKRAIRAGNKQEELQLKTEEALRERQEKLEKKKERLILARQLKQERHLLARVADEKDARKMEMVEVKSETLHNRREDDRRRRAMRGDDVIDLSQTKLKEIPRNLYIGKESLLELSRTILVDLSRNMLKVLPSPFLYSMDFVQKLDISSNNIEILPVSAILPWKSTSN